MGDAEVRDKHEWYKAQQRPSFASSRGLHWQGEQLPKGIIARTRKDARACAVSSSFEQNPQAGTRA